MKKVILSLAVIFSVAMVSCGGKKAAEEAADSAAVVVEEAAVEVVDTVNAGTDSAAVDTAVAAVAAVAEQ